MNRPRKLDHERPNQILSQQLHHYEEALLTIVEVTEMSSDDWFENADFAFQSPLLENFNGNEVAQRAKRVGQTILELGKLFQWWSEPPLEKLDIQLLARAAGVFSRRFEALVPDKKLRPNDANPAARAILNTHLAGSKTRLNDAWHTVTPAQANLLAQSIGGTEAIIRDVSHYQQRFESRDVYNRAGIWLAVAESFPAIFEFSAASRGRGKLSLSSEGVNQFLEQEVPRWLDYRRFDWFLPQRLEASLWLLTGAVEQFGQRGMRINTSWNKDLVATVQNKLLAVLRETDLSSDQRKSAESAFFNLEGLLLPDFR